MHRTITNIFMLAVGAVIGSAATWVYSQKKYSQLIQSEIEKTKNITQTKNLINLKKRIFRIQKKKNN